MLSSDGYMLVKTYIHTLTRVPHKDLPATTIGEVDADLIVLDLSKTKFLPHKKIPHKSVFSCEVRDLYLTSKKYLTRAY